MTQKALTDRTTRESSYNAQVKEEDDEELWGHEHSEIVHERIITWRTESTCDVFRHS